MPNKQLGVTPVKQQTEYYCGPANAEMVLTFLGVAQPAGPATWQDQIYDYITKNTNAKRPSLKKAPDDPENNPAFKEQKCDKCASDPDYYCWSTTPNVLKNFLNANQSVTTYQVSRRTTERSATDAVLDNIDMGRPCIVLAEGWNHYLVIDGYRHDEKGSVSTFGRNLNGIWVCDPLHASAVQYIDFEDWEDTYMGFVPCGTYAEEIVVLRAKS